MDEDLRQTPLYRALHRTNLFLGGERELVLITAIVCAGLAFSALNIVAAIIAAVVWLIAIGLLRQMAKADPNMSRIYFLQLKYQTYYAARSRPFRRD